MMNTREFEVNKNLFVILDKNLRLVYFNKFTKSTVESIIKELEIQMHIKQNKINYKGLKNHDFKIDKSMINNSHIFIIEIEVKVLFNFINNTYIKKSKNSKDEDANIKNEIENLRDKLNLLMKNNYKNNYEKVLEVSVKLDSVINEYCMLEKDK